MFFKAIFALYFAAIALAAPKNGLVDIGDVRELRVNLCSLMLCTRLSNVGIDGNEVIKEIVDGPGVDVLP